MTGVVRFFSRIYVFFGINEDSSFNRKRKVFTMKKLTLALFLGLLVIASLHAQQTVVIERPGILTDLATAAGTIVTLPLAAVEGIVVGTVEAAGSLIHGSTQIVVAPPAGPVPAPWSPAHLSAPDCRTSAGRRGTCCGP